MDSVGKMRKAREHDEAKLKKKKNHQANLKHVTHFFNEQLGQGASDSFVKVHSQIGLLVYSVELDNEKKHKYANQELKRLKKLSEKLAKLGIKSKVHKGFRKHVKAHKSEDGWSEKGMASFDSFNRYEVSFMVDLTQKGLVKAVKKLAGKQKPAVQPASNPPVPEY